MKLHGVEISPNVRKVIIACIVKGIDYELNPIIPGPALKEPEFLKLNPLGQIPALEDGDLTIGDSNIILQYLEEKHPETSILPTTLEDRARSRWLAEYAGSALFPCCGTMFREVFVNPNFFKQATNQEAVDENVSERFPPVLDYLEIQTPSDGFLTGSTFSVADISVISMFITASYGGYEVDANRWPKLADYIGRMLGHPAVAQCIEREQEMIRMITG